PIWVAETYRGSRSPLLRDREVDRAGDPAVLGPGLGLDLGLQPAPGVLVAGVARGAAVDEPAHLPAVLIRALDLTRRRAAVAGLLLGRRDRAGRRPRQGQHAHHAQHRPRQHRPRELL